jgi:hypothetical protein
MQTTILALTLLATGAMADDAPSTEAIVAQASAPLSFVVIAGAWMIRLRGDASYGGADNLSLDKQLGMDDLEATFRGEFRLGRDDWGIWIMGSDFGTSGSGRFAENGIWDGATFTAGEAYRSRFDYMNLAAEAQWNPLDLVGEPNTKIPVFLTVGGHLGVLYSDIRQTLDFGTTRSEEKGEFASLYGGIQLTLRMDTMDRVPWLKKIEFRAAGGAGGTLGHDGGVMYHARADMRFYFLDNVAFLFGYRLLEQHVEKGNWEASPSLQGLFVGGTIEF